jgi:hypothetical protein
MRVDNRLRGCFLVFRQKMRALIILFMACLLGHKAHGWGGLFNRFSPEMLANMGYGGHGGFIQVRDNTNNSVNNRSVRGKHGEKRRCFHRIIDPVPQEARILRLSLKRKYSNRGVRFLCRR